MKKLMTMFLALALAASLTVPALATFTPSVENKGAPEIVSATLADGTDVKDSILVTPYARHGTAIDTIKQSLEDAHKDVQNAGTMDKLTAEVNTWLAAKHAGVKPRTCWPPTCSMSAMWTPAETWRRWTSL